MQPPVSTSIGAGRAHARAAGPRSASLRRLVSPLAPGALLGMAHGGQARAAPAVTGTWRIETGQVSYRVRHSMHDAQGTSHEVSGQAECAAGVCMLALTVPVASFVTKDPDRDMRAVTRAAAHPLVRIGGALRELAGDALAGAVRIDFASATVELPAVRERFERHWRSVEAAGSFDLSLRAFSITPPALLGIPIDDAVTIEFHLTLRRG